MHDILTHLKHFFTSRMFVLAVVMVLLMSLLLGRAFSLQIISGADYQESFTVYIERDLTTDATRGNIYDCNGVLLAGNELSYTVEIADTGSYSSTKVKNQQLNAVIAELVEEIRQNGESITNDFQIDLNDDGTYSYNVSGSSLTRFLVNVFGHSSSDELKVNDMGFNEATATAEQVMEYLLSADYGYSVSDEYSQQTAYEIVVIRYALAQYSFKRYQAITVAENVSEKTVAYVNEHSEDLTGVSIQEDTVRVYYQSEYFASIIGYTGKISDSEYEELSAEDDSYTTSDTVGKAGLEQYYESYLRGTNGEQQVYVNNVGKISQVISSTDPVAGNDLYLTIDSELQQAAYYTLEKELAAIVYTNIESGDIPINDVYFALIDNNVLDITEFSSAEAGAYAKEVYAIFEDALVSSLSSVSSQLTSSSPTINNDMSDEMLDYFTYVISMLKENDVLLSDSIDTSDDTYTKWKDGEISPQEYLTYCISQQWIDTTLLEVDGQYADSSEVYDALCSYIIDTAEGDKDFWKIVYEYLIEDGYVTGRQLCLILFEQGVIEYDEDDYNDLADGSRSAYSFIMSKINNIEITPAQLALDPCTGSCVITDSDTGEIKALVSYPGYDNNEMANGVNATYYAALREDNSNPLYNYATQERTAPGSTFKIVSATAGLSEGVIDTTSTIRCNGVFTEVDNEPTCWIYPSAHGNLTVSEALQHSCNVFFYTVGYRLASLTTGNYNDANGIALIQQYASVFGLDQTTGLEIEENQSKVATQYPVMAAIGQSDNNYTTVALARYITAVATGNVYTYQLMSKITDADGEIVASHETEYEDISDTLSDSQWEAIYDGLADVVSGLDEFDDLSVTAAGKTGTAQQSELRPNHGLFVGYAPYDDPEITVAVRISFGYSSHNAAAVASTVMQYYFGDITMDDILDYKASDMPVTTSTSTND